MVSVKNIKISTSKVDLNKLPRDITEHVPKELVTDWPRQKIEFELHDTNVKLANAMRRTLVAELDSQVLFFDNMDFESNDEYILVDFLMHRIMLIPVPQDLTDVYGNLEVENTSHALKSVYSTDIKFNKQVKLPRVRLCQLNPKRKLSIKNIKLVRKVPYHNYTFTLPGAVEYDIIDHNKNQSSLNQQPTKFYLGVNTNGNEDPKNMIRNVCVNLTQRLNQVRVKEGSHTIVQHVDDVVHFTMDNETHTLGGLLQHYVFVQDTSIPLVNYYVKHPSEREVTLNIKHSQADRLFGKAIDLAIADIEKVKKEFN